MEPQPDELAMHQLPSFHETMLTRTHGRGGIVLVLVLAFLVLITGLIVAFFTSVTKETSSTSSYAEGAEAKQLADSAVQMVMGTIKAATATSGTLVAWASQPGMIRTFGSTAGTASGNPLACYKLYSSNNMVVTQSQIGSFNPINDVDANWDQEPALYTDLNSPLMSGTTPRFPIIDPRAAGIVSGSNPYPLVDGFTFSATSGSTFTNGALTSGTKIIDGVLTPANSNDGSARLPMPVKWIYVLQDGSITAPDPAPAGATSVTTATFTTAPASKQPSAENPIVGRIAFWTDDETCKLNINTACGGNPWEPPMFQDTMDYEFSRYSPGNSEFTRYPGHPAIVSLQPVLWSFGGLPQPKYSLFPSMSMPGGPPSGVPSTAYSSNSNAVIYQTNLLALSPRNALGGSFLSGSATAGYYAQNRTPVPLDTDRLFASVDEMMFSMPAVTGTRPANAFASPTAPAPSMINSALDKLRFFLTTSSRAPEVNMFNLPKVTMWPEPDVTAGHTMVGNSASTGGTNNRTAMDNMIAFCSTLNHFPYYFTRYDSTSPTNDFNAANGPSQARNMALFNYVNGLLKQPIPGFGGTFDGQAGRTGEQILTLCADYIRSAINLADPTNVVFTGGSNGEKYPYSYTIPPWWGNITLPYLNTGTGQVAPLEVPMTDGTVRGIGRFPTIKSANLMFIAHAANQPPVMVNSNMVPIATTGTFTVNPMHPWLGAPPPSASISGTTVSATNLYANHPGMPYLSNALTSATGPFVANPSYSGTTLAPNQTQIEAIFFIDPVNVAAGYIGLGINYTIQVDGLSQFKVNNIPLFPGVKDGTPEVGLSNTPAWGGTSFYDIGKESHTILRWSGGTGKSKLNYWSGFNSNWPATTNWPTISPSGSYPYGEAFNFQGGNVTVRFYQYVPSTTATNNCGPLIQTLTINFPDATFPTPRLISFTPQASPNLLTSGTTVVSGNLSCDSPNAAGVANSRLGWNSSEGAAPQSTNAPGYYFTMPESSDLADTQGRYKFPVDTIRSVECLYGDTRLISSLATVPGSFFAPHIFYYSTLGTYSQSAAMWSNPWARAAHTLRRGSKTYFTSVNSVVIGASLHPLSIPVASGTYLSISGGISPLCYYGDYGNPKAASSTNTKILGSSVTPNGNYYDYGWPQVTSSVDFSGSTPSFYSPGNSSCISGPGRGFRQRSRRLLGRPIYQQSGRGRQFGCLD